MSMKFTLLGTGDAAQVPVYGCDCSVCTRARASTEFRRLPCSALLEIDGKKMLIDSGITDLAERFPAGSLSHILQTHYHADHVQGLLHLRWGKGDTIPVTGPQDEHGFADLFKHSGILDFSHTLQHGETWQWQGIESTALALNHSKPTLGYVFCSDKSRVAYLTDTVGLPDATLAYLAGLRLNCLIIDCAHPPQSEPPRNHNDFNMVRYLVGVLRCDEVILTHIGHEMDAWAEQNSKAVSAPFVLARDGMQKVFE